MTHWPFEPLSGGLAAILVCVAGIALRCEDVPPPLAEPGASATSNAQPTVAVTVTGKYGGLVGDEIEVVDNPTRFVLVDPTLLKRALQLRSRKDNVRLIGRYASAEGGERFEVESLELAPSDAESYRAEIGRVPAAAGAERSRAMAEILVRMARAQAKIPDPEVAAGLREAAEGALRGADAGALPDEVEKLLAQVRTVHELLGDRDVTFHLLVDLAESFPGNEMVLASLRTLNCRRHSGRWVTYEEFKKLEGFVLHEGKWLRPNEKDLLQTVAEFHRSRQVGQVLRRRTEREYKLLADRGSVDVGMRPEEVYRALGPPDRVERRGYAQKEFDQWIYGSRYCYFFDGLLVKAPAAQDR